MRRGCATPAYREWMTDTMADVRRHNADYGFDGDARSLARGRPVAATLSGTVADSILATMALFIRTTRVGKFEVRAQILDDLALRGDETLLDLGCGRGAVLLAAAKLLPNGRAIGVDIWRADQTGNSPHNTLTNAAVEGVADRVEVRTADITDLPYDDDSVDVIVSSLAVHNISNQADRLKAVSEAARGLGWTDVTVRPLGWRMWWGPGLGTHLLVATKPAA